MFLRLRPSNGSKSSPAQAQNGVLNFTIPSIPPFSPVSSSFNHSLNPDSSPSNSDDPSAEKPPSSSQNLTDREKRRKMAKLARTLGENIPPELVFQQLHSPGSSSVAASGAGSSTTTNGNPNSSTSSLARSMSLGLRGGGSSGASGSGSGIGGRRTSAGGGVGGLFGHKLTKSISGAVSSPSRAALDVPPPPPVPKDATTPATTSSTTKRKRPGPLLGGPKKAKEDEATATSSTTSLDRTKSGRKSHRPRSLTLGNLSAFSSPALVAASNAAAAASAASLTDSAESGASSLPPPLPVSKDASQSVAIRPRPTRSGTSLDSPRALPPLPPHLSSNNRDDDFPIPQMRPDQPFAFVINNTSVEPAQRGSLESFTTASAGHATNESHSQTHLGIPGQSCSNGQFEGYDGRRKEREWSGEWNVRDMERVAKALRGLKGR